MMIFEDWSVTQFRAACLRIENTTGWDLLALAWGVLFFPGARLDWGTKSSSGACAFRLVPFTYYSSVWTILGQPLVTSLVAQIGLFVSIILKYTHFTLITVEAFF